MNCYKYFGLSEMKPVSSNMEISGMHGLTQLQTE